MVPQSDPGLPSILARVLHCTFPCTAVDRYGTLMGVRQLATVSLVLLWLLV